MIHKRMFTSMDELLHFIAEESPEQFAVLRSGEAEWELAFFTAMEDQPTVA